MTRMGNGLQSAGCEGSVHNRVTRGAILLLAFACVLLVARPATAVDVEVLGEPVRLEFTESMYLNWHGDPGNGNPSWSDYGEFINRLNVQASARKIRFGLRLDSSAFLSPPTLGERLAKANCETCIGVVRETDLRDRFQNRLFDPRKGVEKISLSYLGRDVEATLGDFYANFGRGLVLSVRKLDELGVDTTLLGGKVAWRNKYASATALAGLANVQNLDEASATAIEDPDDVIGGARIEGRLFDKVLVGVHGAGGFPLRERHQLAGVPTDRFLRYGVSVDAPKATKNLSLYAEGALRSDRVIGADTEGSALYAALTAYTGMVTWLLEAKDYRAWEPWHATIDPFSTLVFQQAPTLERVQTQLSTNSDITATRLRSDVRFGPRLTAFAAAEYGRLSPAHGIEYDLYDAYLGTQLRWQNGKSHAFPLVGYRQEVDRADGHVAERLVALEWDLAQALPRDFSVETAGMVWIRQKGLEVVPGSGDNAWNEGNAYLAGKWGSKVVVAGGYEFTSLARESLNRHNFFNASAQWNVDSQTSLRFFAGGQRPGLRCISGLCRVFPAFSGVKLEVVVRR